MRPDLRQRQAVENRAHRVLANAEVQVAAAGVLGAEVAAPSNVRRVLQEGPRSAEPPRSHGTLRAMAFSAWPEASRVAMPLSSAANDGSPRSQPSGSSRRSMR